MRSMEISTTLTTAPVDDARLAEILANPGFGTYFTDHMVTVEWTPDRGLARRAGDAVRPADARPRDRGPALRAGDLRGHEGLPARRRLRSGRSGPRRTPSGWCAPATASRCPCSTRPTSCRPSRRWSRVDQRWVPEGAGEKSLYLRPFMIATEAFLGVRPAQHVTFMVIASPAGAYFSKGPLADHALADQRLHPRRPRRHGRGQDRRQLRVVAGRRSRRPRPRAATRWSSSTARSCATSRSSAA